MRDGCFGRRREIVTIECVEQKHCMQLFLQLKVHILLKKMALPYVSLIKVAKGDLWLMYSMWLVLHHANEEYR